MKHIRISEASKLLGVNKITLIRWDKDGLLITLREPISNTRYYDEDKILNVKKWFDLRKKHRELLNRLEPLRKEVDKFISTTPLSEQKNPKIHKFEEMKKAFDEMNKWEKEHEEILKEYSAFVGTNFGALEK